VVSKEGKGRQGGPGISEKAVQSQMILFRGCGDDDSDLRFLTTMLSGSGEENTAELPDD
jgi:hypothetical protein